VSLRDDVRRALVMQVIANEVTAAAKAARHPIDAELSNADRVNVASPADESVKLGMAYRTETKATATVPDEDALVGWFGRHYPDRVEMVPEFNAERMAEIMAIVEAHDPELVHYVPRVKSWARHEVLTLAVQHRQAVGPEGEMDDLAPPVVYHPPKLGTLTLKPSSEAADHIRELWQQGRIDLATGTIRELES
jgi:hypothetical protein